jgi:transposase
MNKAYRVDLTDAERKQLEDLVRKGKGPAYRIRHAYILLNSDINNPKKSDQEIADYLHCHLQTVYNIRKQFVKEGLETALERKQRETPPTPNILDGEKEAKLITLACSKPPEGRGSWTLRLLSDKHIELEIVETISPNTVGRALKKRIKTTSSKMLGNTSRSKR